MGRVQCSGDCRYCKVDHSAFGYCGLEFGKKQERSVL